MNLRGRPELHANTQTRRGIIGPNDRCIWIDVFPDATQ
jgi:hypothetical protein